LGQALQLNARDEPTHSRLAKLLAGAGRTNEALAEFQAALALKPGDAELLDDSGIFLASLGRSDEAVSRYAAAARLAPDDWRPPYLTALALFQQHRDPEAVPYLWQALRASPEDLPLLSLLAQVLASDENPQARNGQDAFTLATKANALTGGDQPSVLDLLAMACAELGRFDDAQKAAREALQLSQSNGLTNDAAQIQQRLQLYETHVPFRQSFAGATGLAAPKP
jgi:Tfp pilus assembly protein PilF